MKYILAEMTRLPQKFRNPYEDRAVILTPISDEIINDENLEPQMVRIREANNSYVSLDNFIRSDSEEPFNLTLGGNQPLFASKIKRFGLDYFSFLSNIPNVNPRNNILTFEYNLPGQRATITIPEGVYTTAKQLLDEFIVQLNTVTGTTGLTFSYTQPQDTAGTVIQPYCATITAVGGTFRFYDLSTGLTSPMTERGDHLIGLSKNNTFTASKKVGQIHLIYTRYIDIISFAFLQYTKNPNVNNDLGANNHFFRLYWWQAGEFQNFGTYNIGWTNYLSSQTLTNIDLRFIDEYGDDLYAPDCHQDGTKSNLTFLLDIITQL